MPEQNCPVCRLTVGQAIVFCGLPAGIAGRFGSPIFLAAANTIPRYPNSRLRVDAAVAQRTPAWSVESPNS